MSNSTQNAQSLCTCVFDVYENESAESQAEKQRAAQRCRPFTCNECCKPYNRPWYPAPTGCRCSSPGKPRCQRCHKTEKKCACSTSLLVCSNRHCRLPVTNDPYRLFAFKYCVCQKPPAGTCFECGGKDFNEHRPAFVFDKNTLTVAHGARY